MPQRGTSNTAASPPAGLRALEESLQADRQAEAGGPACSTARKSRSAFETVQALLSGNEREQGARKWARPESVSFGGTAESICRSLGEPCIAPAERRGHPARALAIVLSRWDTSLTLREIGIWSTLRRFGLRRALPSHTPYGSDTARKRQLASIAERSTKWLALSNVEICPTCSLTRMPPYLRFFFKRP